MKRILFDKYEAAILLDGYLQTLNGKDRKQAVKEVSESLRKMAVNRGLAIDKTYRNFTGIYMQMAVMEYLYTNGRLGLKHTSGIFTKTIDLYRKNSNLYEEILDTAKEMIGGPKKDSETVINDEIQQYGIEDSMVNRLNEVLHEYFPDGFIPDCLGLDEFRDAYSDKYNETLDFEDDYIFEQLKTIGLLIDGRIVPQVNKNKSSLIQEILDDIKSTLEAGAGYIYINCLLERWQNELADQIGVFSEKALRDYLIAQNDTEIVITNYVIKFPGTTETVWNLVDKFMSRQPSPLSLEQIHNEMWYIPKESIKRMLINNKAVASFGNGFSFYSPNFPVSSNELQKIKYYMHRELNMKGYLVADDIKKIIMDKVPSVELNTGNLSAVAYRNVLAYLLRNDFEFNSAIITEIGINLDVKQVYSDFCTEHPHFTFDELKQLSNDLHVVIYWNTILGKAVRLNPNEFISRELIHFDIEKTDLILDKLCSKDYTPIKDVDLFIHFPYVGHPWNIFLLECYLLQSKVFQLLHMSYSEHKVCGVIVRKNSIYKTYEQVVIDMLANDKTWNSASEALNIVVSKGYQARRKWTGFDRVAKEAKLMREKFQSSKENGQYV